MSQRMERSTSIKLEGMAGWLTHHAARRAPESLSSRLEEEWLADLASRCSALSRLRFAVGCCWASMVIVSDYPRSRVPAASSAVGARGLITLADRHLDPFFLRSGTLFLVAGLHATLFYGLITALSHTRRLATAPDLQNQVLKPVLPETLPTPPPRVTKLKAWVIDAQKLLVDVPPRIDFEKDVTTRVVEKFPEPQWPKLPPETPTHVVGESLGVRAPDFPTRLTSIRPSRFIWKKRACPPCESALILKVNFWPIQPR